MLAGFKGGEIPLSNGRKAVNCGCFTLEALSYYLLIYCMVGLAFVQISWQTVALVWLFSFRPCCVCCTRPKLRAQLSIRGAVWEDTFIHWVAHPCALCQEMREVDLQRANADSTFSVWPIHSLCATQIFNLPLCLGPFFVTCILSGAATGGTSMQPVQPVNTSAPSLEEQLLGN